ncbi:hypothetical protein ACFY4C_39320 [Actinomadura viridis]|uniref:hypothetical protein n=1 Tax=Actinomadura viridis TaxID=58110 RepID=UPI00369C3920
MVRLPGPGSRPSGPRSPGPRRLRDRPVPHQPALRAAGRRRQPARTRPGRPSVHLRRRPGDPIGELDGNAARLGHILVTGTDPAAVDARADQLVSSINITVHPAQPQ